MRYLKSFVVLSVFALFIFATDPVSSSEIIEITGQYDGIAKQVIDKVADSKKVPTVDELDKILNETIEKKEGINKSPRVIKVILNEVCRLAREKSEKEGDFWYLVAETCDALFLQKVILPYTLTFFSIILPEGIVFEVTELHYKVQNESPKADPVWTVLKKLKDANVLKQIDDQLVKDIGSPIYKIATRVLVAEPQVLPEEGASGICELFHPFRDRPWRIWIWINLAISQDDIDLRWVLIHELVHAKLNFYIIHDKDKPFESHDDKFNELVKKKYTDLRKHEGISEDQINKEIKELEEKYKDPEAGKKRGKK